MPDNLSDTYIFIDCEFKSHMFQPFINFERYTHTPQTVKRKQQG